MSDEEYARRLKETGRNDPCACGSGKKYKKCHLPEDEERRSAALAEAAREAAAKEAEAAEAEEKKGGPPHPPEFKGHKKAPHPTRPAAAAVARQVSTPRKSGAS